MTQIYDHIGKTYNATRQADPRIIAEAIRVTRGPVVIFTFDAHRKTGFWLDDYFPDLRDIDAGFGFSIADVQSFARSLGRQCETHPYPLPPDLRDHFLAAGWARPEIYLDEKYRDGISSFSRIGKEALQGGLRELRNHLDSGLWHRKYAGLETLDALDLGYLFLKIH